MGAPRNRKIPLCTFGEILRPTRHKLNLTLGQLSELTGISVATLSAGETGRQPVTDKTAQNIANCLRLEGAERDALIQAADETRRAVVIEAQELLGRRIASKLARKIKNMSFEELASLYAAIKRARIDQKVVVQLQLQFQQDLTERDVRAITDRFVAPKSAQDIQNIANIARAESGKSIDEPVDVVEFVEFEMPRIFDLFEYEIIPECSARVGFFGDAKIIPIGKRSARLVRLLRLTSDVYENARRHESSAVWMIAHELGHLFLNHISRARQGSEIDNAKITRPQWYRTAEWQADEFAAAFLMPREACDSLTPFEISRKFCVSARIAEMRKRKLVQRRAA